MSGPETASGSRIAWPGVARGVVIGMSGAAAVFFVAGVFHALFLHEHPPDEFRHAHEWDILVLSVFSGLAGLFAAIAVSAWRRWAWWKRLLVVVMGPVVGIATLFALAYAKHWNS